MHNYILVLMGETTANSAKSFALAITLTCSFLLNREVINSHKQKYTICCANVYINTSLTDTCKRHSKWVESWLCKKEKYT
jgi:hypothetical protein